MAVGNDGTGSYSAAYLLGAVAAVCAFIASVFVRRTAHTPENAVV
jgi:hypothetical protein